MDRGEKPRQRRQSQYSASPGIVKVVDEPASPALSWKTGHEPQTDSSYQVECVALMDDLDAFEARVAQHPPHGSRSEMLQVPGQIEGPPIPAGERRLPASKIGDAEDERPGRLEEPQDALERSRRIVH